MGYAATDHRAVAVVVGQLCLMPQPRAAAACLWRRWHLFEESEAMSQLAPPPDGSNAAFGQELHKKTVRHAASGSQIATVKREQVSLPSAAASQATIGRRGSGKRTKSR